MMIKYTALTVLACSLSFCGLNVASASSDAPVSVEVWPLHRGGSVTYQYKVTNLGSKPIDAVTIGWNPDAPAVELSEPPACLSKSFWLSPDKASSPVGWGAAVRYSDESPKFSIEWIEGNKELQIHPRAGNVTGTPTPTKQANLLPPGKTWDAFSITLEKDDPGYVKGHATVSIGEDIVTVPIKKGDTTPPSVSVSILQVTHPDPTTSILSFSVSATDNYDVAPTIILESVKSDKQLPQNDVKSQIGSDVRTVTLKNVSGRKYYITFSATDASGNKGRKTLTFVCP